MEELIKSLLEKKVYVTAYVEDGVFYISGVRKGLVIGHFGLSSESRSRLAVYPLSSVKYLFEIDKGVFDTFE